MTGGRVALAVALTGAWTLSAVFYMSELWPPLVRADAVAFGHLLLARPGEVAFFWLVVGYIWLATAVFQQAANVRRQAAAVQSAADRAEGAARSLELQTERLNEREVARVRAAQPRWEIQASIAHKEQHEITLRNAGAPAFNIRAVTNRKPRLAVLLSNPAFIDRGQHLTLKVVFPEQRLEDFEIPLEYADATGEVNKASISVSPADARVLTPATMN